VLALPALEAGWYVGLVRLALLVAMSVALLGTTAIETLARVLDPVTECGGNDDPCPPFSDDCHDCASCVHFAALPAVYAGPMLTIAPPVLRAAPSPLERPRPNEAPAREILTVPRA
jgi:hypothetical protein